MKKLIGFLLCGVLLFGLLAGCGGADHTLNAGLSSPGKNTPAGTPPAGGSGAGQTSGDEEKGGDDSSFGSLSGGQTPGPGDGEPSGGKQWPTWTPEPVEPIVVPDPVPVPDPEFVTLSGPQFQDPLAYFGLNLWDLETRSEDECSLLIEEVDDEFLREFISDMENLNPQFALMELFTDDMRRYGGSYQMVAKYAYTPAAGQPDVEKEDDWHFKIGLKVSAKRGTTELYWEWEDGITFGDVGVRADVKPVSLFAKPTFAPTGAAHPSIRLSGTQFQDPLAFYGLTIWDLEDSYDYRLDQSASLLVDGEKDGYLAAEFVRMVQYLNPRFKLWKVHDDDMREFGGSWYVTCEFDYIPENGTPNEKHNDFSITIKIKGSEVELSWSWGEDVTLVDTGLRAAQPLKSLSTKKFFVAIEPSEYAGRLSGGPQFQDPVAYFNIPEDQIPYNRENTKKVEVSQPGRALLKEFLADVEKLNPEFDLFYVTEDDYYKVGGDYYLHYYFRYEPADGDWHGVDPNEDWHFAISLVVDLFSGDGTLSWSWKDGVILADAEIRAEDLPDSWRSNSGSSSSGGSSGGNSGGGSSWDRDDDDDKPMRRSCINCFDGEVECSRCDGDGGKWIYVTVPNYSGKGDTEKEKWDSCDKCYGKGKLECSVCDGDGWVND